MCEVNPDVKLEEALKLRRQKQKEEEAKKASAKSGDDCCEPLCSPITCGP